MRLRTRLEKGRLRAAERSDARGLPSVSRPGHPNPCCDSVRRAFPAFPPSRPCSAASVSSSPTWVRDVAAPLTLAYTGQKPGGEDSKRVQQVSPAPPRYDKLGAVAERTRQRRCDRRRVHFVLADKRRVTIKALGPLVGALRMTACGYFTTVLGPGADPQHGNAPPSRHVLDAWRYGKLIASANNRAARLKCRRTAGGQRFRSSQLHQEVRANRSDFLRHRIARHSRGLRRHLVWWLVNLFRPSPRPIGGASGRKSLAANFRFQSCCLRQVRHAYVVGAWSPSARH